MALPDTIFHNGFENWRSQGTPIMTPRRTALSALPLSLLLSATLAHADPLLWEGTLQDGMRPAEGRYDLKLRLYDRHQGGVPLGEATEFPGVTLKDGRFALPLDLSPIQATRNEIWLEVAARVAGDGHFETLPSRSLLKGGQLACWSTTGNVVAPNAGFLGTTNDDSFLDLRAGNRRVMRYFYLPDSPASPIILGGHDSNSGFFPGSTIAGGGGGGALAHIAFAPFGSIGGGFGNQTGSFANQDATAATVSGGQNNRAQATSSTVGGGSGKTVSGFASTIGGGRNSIATSQDATVAGGGGNTASGLASTVGGGRNSNATGDDATVGGGSGNTASGSVSTVGGGSNNSATGSGATVSGGSQATANGIGSTIAGGAGVTINADFGTIGGGLFILVDGERGTVSGGQGNRASRFASVGGGEGNEATGDHSTIPGGFSNEASAAGSFAAGRRARAIHDGAFVWADSQDANFSSTGANQFLVRAQGGAAINSTNPAGNALRVNGTLRVDTLGAAAATTLCRNASNQISGCSSSKRYKQDIADLELGLAAALQLRAVAYAWKDTGAADVGFVAEEIGLLDERLVTRNAEGAIEGVKYDRLTAVLANAVQELAARDSVTAESLAQMRAENAELRARLERLETLMAQRGGAKP